MKAIAGMAIAIIGAACNLAFWLALAYGLLCLLSHFGILRALGVS